MSLYICQHEEQSGTNTATEIQIHKNINSIYVHRTQYVCVKVQSPKHNNTRVTQILLSVA